MKAPRAEPLLIGDRAYISYPLWFGWRYLSSEKGMFRLGDRWENDTDMFNILAGDQAGLHLGGWGHGSHPDGAGVWANEVLQDQTPPWASGIGLTDTLTQTWWYNTSVKNGPLDLNYAYQDGSVTRLNAVRWEEGDPGKTDERVTRVFTNGDGTNPTRVLQAPKAR